MRKGFTLVEILAVVVLLLVVMLFTTPVLKKLINNGDEKERALIEERILIAAKEYASSYDNGFYDKLVRVGDYNYVYKTDLLKSGLIELDDLDKLDGLVGVKGELLVDDKVKYTLSYIDNPVNGYCEEEVYTMIQQLQEEVSYLRNNPSGGSSGEGSSSLSSVLEAYPIGSLYISTTSTNPGTLFGGTWVSFGSGKTLVGVDTNNSKFNTVEKTGGNESVSYTPSGSVGSHTLTVAELPSHTHSYVKATGVGSHTLTVAELPSHTHSIPALSGTAASAGAHSHNIKFKQWGGAVGNTTWLADIEGTLSVNVMDGTTGAHTHSVTTNASTTGSSGSGNGHTHSLTTSSDTTGSSGSGNGHTHSFSGTTSNIDVLDPYITVYMWKRTA